MLNLKELNQVAYLIGLIEGKNRSLYCQGAAYSPSLVQKLYLLWEEKSKKSMESIKSCTELRTTIKKGLLIERDIYRNKGVKAYSERVIKSKKF